MWSWWDHKITILLTTEASTRDHKTTKMLCMKGRQAHVPKTLSASMQTSNHSTVRPRRLLHRLWQYCNARLLQMRCSPIRGDSSAPCWLFRGFFSPQHSKQLATAFTRPPLLGTVCFRRYSVRASATSLESIDAATAVLTTQNIVICGAKDYTLGLTAGPIS